MTMYNTDYFNHMETPQILAFLMWAKIGWGNALWLRVACPREVRIPVLAPLRFNGCVTMLAGRDVLDYDRRQLLSICESRFFPSPGFGTPLDDCDDEQYSMENTKSKKSIPSFKMLERSTHMRKKKMIAAAIPFQVAKSRRPILRPATMLKVSNVDHTVRDMARKRSRDSTLR